MNFCCIIVSATLITFSYDKIKSYFDYRLLKSIITYEKSNNKFEINLEYIFICLKDYKY